MLKTYQETIDENSDQFNDPETLADFIADYTTQGEVPTLEDVQDLEDNLSEYADGLVPIYYYEITKEWQETGECHQMTVEQCGEYAEKDIYKMMQSDLYFYYEQQLREDWQALVNLMEEQEETEAGVTDFTLDADGDTATVTG